MQNIWFSMPAANRPVNIKPSTTGSLEPDMSVSRNRRSQVAGRKAADAGVQSSSEIVRAGLENLIISGKLAPGSRLNEEELAGHFGTSRTPVREALLQLSSIGLVHTRPRQSAIVAQLTVTEIVQSFEFNLELECICARLAARRMSANERSTLEEIVKRMRRIVRKDDKVGYVELNRAFHYSIYAGSHNRIIDAQAQWLFSRLAPYRRQVLLRPGQTTVSLQQHEHIQSAIAAGDEVAAEHAMRTHASLEDSSFLDIVAMIQSSRTPQDAGP
jgi:DNA-binding GntR family transcriptional regulator